MWRVQPHLLGRQDPTGSQPGLGQQLAALPIERAQVDGLELCVDGQQVSQPTQRQHLGRRQEISWAGCHLYSCSHDAGALPGLPEGRYLSCLAGQQQLQ